MKIKGKIRYKILLVVIPILILTSLVIGITAYYSSKNGITTIAKAFTNKAIGGVVDNIGNGELICNVYSETSLKIGTKVLIYRTTAGKLPKYIAEGVVSMVDPMFVLIKITKKTETVKQQDKIYKK